MAKSSIPVDQYDFYPNGTDQRLTVDSTSGGVQFTKYSDKVTHILYSVEDAQCRFTLDASAPTTTNGHVLEAGDMGIWPVSWFYAMKLIRTTATSAVIHASPLTKAGHA